MNVFIALPTGPRVPGRCLFRIIHIDVVVIDFRSQDRYVPNIPVHSFHQTLILVDKATHCIPRIHIARQIAVRLSRQITRNRPQQLRSSTSCRLFAARCTRIEAIAIDGPRYGDQQQNAPNEFDVLEMKGKKKFEYQKPIMPKFT